jgi:hypothetical protein
MQAPNLDDMGYDDLGTFARETQQRADLLKTGSLAQRRLAETLELLVGYAKIKRRAIVVRKDGFIECALQIEAFLDRTYNSLPETARW